MKIFAVLILLVVISCQEREPATKCIQGFLYYEQEAGKKSQPIPVLSEHQQPIECRSLEDEQ